MIYRLTLLLNMIITFMERRSETSDLPRFFILAAPATRHILTAWHQHSFQAVFFFPSMASMGQGKARR